MKNFLEINFATLNKTFQFDGVTSRRDFWYFVLFNWLVSIGASIVDIFIAGNLTQNIVSILLFVPSITAAIRRMHDTDHAGWWILLPIVNLVFLVSPSTTSRWSDAS
jgi:uncharacterized membrane protein YhaH (DUF805 family)